MCGLAGFNLSPDENVDARDLAVELLLGIEDRGRHATGVAFFEQGEPYVQKADITAEKFVDHLDMDARVTNAILHTRWASQGSPKNNANNHPIDVGGIMGVHNGVIWNDNDLFDRVRQVTGEDKRIAEVDSEAIFATLLHGGEKAPVALGRVKGSASVAWLDAYGDPDLLHAARISSSPFVYAFSEVGSFVFASTALAVKDAMQAVGMKMVGMTHALGEGTYLRVREGEVLTRVAFETHKRGALTAVEAKALNVAG